MNRNLFFTLLLVVCLSWVGVSSAAGQASGENPLPVGGASVDAIVASQMTYQGWYTEAGIPVNGHRDMLFRLHTNGTCTSAVGSNISVPAVSIEDGVFEVLLDVRHEDFNGQALWLKVTIGGLEVGCLPLMPAPYALSLRPGAKIGDDNTMAQLNRAWGSSAPYFKAAVYGEASGSQSLTYGIYGESSNGTGVYGRSNSTAGFGVNGVSSATSGSTVGVRGTSASPQGTGIYGVAYASSGETYGVRGISDSTQGRGVLGEASSTGNGITYGVQGTSSSTQGRGILGEAKATGGAAYGVYGSSDSPDGAGVYALGSGEHDPDLILGGRSASNDNGNIWSDPRYPGSDLFIRSSDEVGIHLNRDGDADDLGHLYIYNGQAQTIFRLDENGFLQVRNDSEDTIFQVSQTGTATVNVLQITGGSDLSERFDVSSAHGELKPGLAVCIDVARPGQLVVCERAYDRTVAGIISGAGGIEPGMVMGQEGSIANGGFPVALSGRVYAWADATRSPIHPGDLLTVSETPGHVMRVQDDAQAQGAIIGKAMSLLGQGRGLVLVLVSLQ